MTDTALVLPAGVAAITYLTADGELTVAAEAAADLPFEDARPARSFPSYIGMRNFPGDWWFATTGEFVGYESWLERDWLRILDQDPTVAAVASQPFWLDTVDRHGRVRHAPDFFVRYADGSAKVLNCRPRNRVTARAARAFTAMEQVSRDLGWGYETVHEPPDRLNRNIEFLSGYRRPLHPTQAALIDAVIDAATDPTPIGVLEAAVDDPVVVRPVVLHLIWHAVLSVDLAGPLHERSVVVVADSKEGPS